MVGALRRRRSDLDLDRFYAEEIIFGIDANCSRVSRNGSNPNGSGAAIFSEGKGVVADDGSRAVQMEGNVAAGVGTRRAELIDCSKCKAGHVGTVGEELGIVGVEVEAIR